MIHKQRTTDERREGTGVECWCLHGTVGMAGDWRGLSGDLARHGIGTRAVDLWRFLEEDGMGMEAFGQALNEEARENPTHNTGRVLVGYSMGGRLALHALLADGAPWQAAVILSAHPGLEDEAERAARRAGDAGWAAKCFAGDWQTFLRDWNAQPVLAGAEPRGEAENRQLAQRRREIARSFVDWSLGAQQPLWGRLREIPVPVLWISGESDGKFSALAARAAGENPRFSHVVAPGSGHRVPWDQPTWLERTMTAFLAAGEIRAKK